MSPLTGLKGKGRAWVAPGERRLTGEGLGSEMRRSATAATGCWNQGKGGKVMRKAAASRRTPYSARPGFGNKAKRGRLKAELRAILPTPVLETRQSGAA
jgi:hypothetical protein